MLNGLNILNPPAKLKDARSLFISFEGNAYGALDVRVWDSMLHRLKQL